LHAAGGGILSTVAAVRAGSEDDLMAATRQHLAWMLEHGTTTAEVKSGYGLDRDNELKMLRAIQRAADASPLDVSPTFLGAHAIPPEFASSDAYVDYLIADVLPDAARHADAADVFLERGAFDAPAARRYLEACRASGLALRLHGDQFSEQGAIPLAIELGARSVDHLEATGADGARTLARSDVTAVLLPACALFLGLPSPPARTLIDEGGIVALATDFNPGSAFCESLPLAMNLACTRLKMSPAEALAACTVNAAHVLGLADRGRLAPGCLADLLLLDAPDWRWLAYHLGGDRFAAKIKRGRLVA
jgi:imidazolonepropionase